MLHQVNQTWLYLKNEVGWLHHRVVTYGEDTYCKKVVFRLSALKPNAEMVSEASRGRYDLDRPENITDCHWQSNRKT